LSDNFKNRAAVGIIDNDKRKPNDFANFTLDKEETGIQRRRKAKTKHTLLIISPAFEDWVFENANAVGVDPAKYGFPNRKSFRNACKTENASANPKLKQFLNTLKQKKSPGFQQLKKWICEGAGIDEKDL
jgi:hypothetical protein